MPVKAYLSILLIDGNYYSQKLFLDVIHTIPGINLCNLAVNGKAAIALLKLMHVMPDVIFLGLNISLKKGLLFLRSIRSSVLTKHIPVIMLADTSGCILKQEVPLESKWKTPTPQFDNKIKYDIEDHICRLQEMRIS